MTYGTKIQTRCFVGFLQQYCQSSLPRIDFGNSRCLGQWSPRRTTLLSNSDGLGAPRVEQDASGPSRCLCETTRGKNEQRRHKFGIGQAVRIEPIQVGIDG